MDNATHQPVEVECRGCLGAGKVVGRYYGPNHPDNSERQCDDCSGEALYLECPECREMVGTDDAAYGTVDRLFARHAEAVAHGWTREVAAYQRAIDDVDSITTHGMCVECDDDRRRAEQLTRSIRAAEHERGNDWCMCCSRPIKPGARVVRAPAHDADCVRQSERTICVPCADRISAALGGERKAVA